MVKDGLDTKGVVAPHGATAGRGRRRPEHVEQVSGRLADEAQHTLGSRVFEGGVELSEGGGERYALSQRWVAALEPCPSSR